MYCYHCGYNLNKNKIESKKSSFLNKPTSKRIYDLEVKIDELKAKIRELKFDINAAKTSAYATKEAKLKAILPLKREYNETIAKVKTYQCMIKFGDTYGAKKGRLNEIKVEISEEQKLIEFTANVNNAKAKAISVLENDKKEDHEEEIAKLKESLASIKEENENRAAKIGELAKEAETIKIYLADSASKTISQKELQKEAEEEFLPESIDAEVRYICPRCGHIIHEGMTNDEAKELSRASHAQIQRANNSFAQGMCMSVLGLILLAIGILFYTLAKKPANHFQLQTNCAEFYVAVALGIASVLLLGFGIAKTIIGVVNKQKYNHLLKDLNNQTFIQ